MTRLEKLELVLIAAVVVATWFATPGLRWSPAIGVLIGYAAALIFAQGFARDIVRLLVKRATTPQRRGIVCLCAESSIGIALIVVAVSLTLLGLTAPVVVTQIRLTAGLAGVLTLGFIAKDFVFTYGSPDSRWIRREKDHASIIPW